MILVAGTPSVVHHGRAEEVLERRHRARMAAYLARPDRFVNGPPQRETLPSAVWINPPAKTTHEDAPGSTIVDPDDPEVVPPCRTYGSFDDHRVMPRKLAAAPKAAH
jgi:hypothetical protein